MDATELLGFEEANAGLVLSDEAKWNQTLLDWQLFLRFGTVFVDRAVDGRVVASAAILPYGSSAWISMVLVSPDWRRRGLATKLVQKCLARADAAGWTTWLDATPDGLNVYGQLGFRVVGELVRMARRRGSAASHVPPRSPTVRDVRRLITLDAQGLGIGRSAFIEDVTERSGSVLYRTGSSYCLTRDGRRARQIGPVLARSEPEAIKLLDKVLANETGDLIIDLHTGNDQVRRYLLANDFVEERRFYRMIRGSAHNPPDQTVAIASAGPEFG